MTCSFLLRGGALDSCQCDMGFKLCPGCNATSLQCVCGNIGGSGKKTTLMDMSKPEPHKTMISYDLPTRN